MIIDGHTKTCGLIGNPVEHTLSPVIHNTLAHLSGINLAYMPFLVKEEAVEDAVRGAHALHICGLNVTVPHKERVIPYLCGIDPLAEKIGAVNTLVYRENGYEGFNTDMPGLYRAMQSDGICLDNREVILLGAGGVARAVAVMLCERADRLYIVNRTLQKAQSIAEEVNGYAGREMARALTIEDGRLLPGRSYLCIQATNVGMYPGTEEAVIEDAAFYEKIEAGYDLIYNPFETKFMKLVKQAGGKACNGLKMLLYQGIIAFELWNGIQVTDSQAKEVYRRLMNSL